MMRGRESIYKRTHTLTSLSLSLSHTHTPTPTHPHPHPHKIGLRGKWSGHWMW
jgi:hypothetical protein